MPRTLNGSQKLIREYPRNNYPDRWSGVHIKYLRADQRTGSSKAVGTAPTDFVTVGKKPLDFQRKTVGEPFLLGFSGNMRVKGESRYLRGTFFFFSFRASAPERTSGELVLFRVASCWIAGAPHFLSYWQWACRNSARFVQGKRGESVGTREKGRNHE